MDTLVSRFQLSKRSFVMSAVRGLSREALDLHLDLYDDYIKETQGLLM